MTEPLGAGVTWQQLLAFGVAGLFAGAVKLLDLLHRPVAVPPFELSFSGYGEERALVQQRRSVLSLDE